MPTTIIGVDFSGAEPNYSAVTEAILERGCLAIESCYCLPKKRADAHTQLENLLQKLPNGAGVAMDFPFSVPQVFADELITSVSSMPDVWAAVTDMKYATFLDRRNKFVKDHGEMTRRGDAYFRGPISPLKTGGPNMLPMTFYGMRMLDRLWKSDKSFRVPPLDDAGRTGPVLLETMPGVLLRIFGLPARNYKKDNKTNNNNSQKVRRGIINGLPDQLREVAGLSLNIPRKAHNTCEDNPDCLDSLVAAIAAAAWKWDCQQFRHPTDDELPTAQLEGWIYAPLPPPQRPNQPNR